MKLKMCWCRGERSKEYGEKMAENISEHAHWLRLMPWCWWKCTENHLEKSLWILTEISCWTEIIVCGLLNLSWIPFWAFKLIKTLFPVNMFEENEFLECDWLKSGLLSKYCWFFREVSLWKVVIDRGWKILLCFIWWIVNFLENSKTMKINWTLG